MSEYYKKWEEEKEKMVQVLKPGMFADAALGNQEREEQNDKRN